MQKFRHRSARVLAATSLAVTSLAVTSLAAAPAQAQAPAPAQAWKLAASPNATIPGGQLEAVSCSAPDACTAVGSNLGADGIYATLAERWNGKAWKRQPTPNPAEDTVPDVRPDLLGVSCPAASFCLAVGTYLLNSIVVSFAETWNGRSWTERGIPVPAGFDAGGLDQVSCVSAKFCAAVGSAATPSLTSTQTLAATWNGTRWHVRPTPNPAGDTGLPGQKVSLTGVSCVTAKFCEAVGNGNERPPGFAEQWNGTSWTLQRAPAPSTGRVTAVSCRSVRFCEAVGPGTADVWHGKAWRAQAFPASGPTSSINLTGVSCVSVSFCEAVGQAESAETALSAAIRWNGTRWARQSTPNPADAGTPELNAVSCASVSSCEAAGVSAAQSFAHFGTTLALAWNGAFWKLQPAVSPAGAVRNTLDAVSCVSASFCEAVGEWDDGAGDQFGLAERWTGTAWILQSPPSPQVQGDEADDALMAVSCVSVTFCEAVGVGPGGASAEQWNGRSWIVQPRPGSGVQPQSVSCVSASFCMAVDGFGHVALWDGSAWSAGSNVTGFSQVSSVSCASVSDCEAVGGGPAGQDAAGWDGHSWTAQSTPGPPSLGLEAISCPAASACEAAGDFRNAQDQPVAAAEKWNGSAWTLQHPPRPSPSISTSLGSVWCASADSCTAVGLFEYTTDTPDHGLAEVWNGTSWGLRSTPDPFDTGSFLGGVSCAASRSCVAVGVDGDVGGVGSTLIETGD